MANKHPTDTPARQATDPATLTAWAWDLFSRNVNVAGISTTTNEYLAEQCFKAAEAFDTIANHSKPEPKA